MTHSDEKPLNFHREIGSVPLIHDRSKSESSGLLQRIPLVKLRQFDYLRLDIINLLPSTAMVHPRWRSPIFPQDPFGNLPIGPLQ